MRYSYNKTREIINGVIFYFDEGDEEIATDVLKLVEASEKPPTSIVWNGECLTAAEVLHKLLTDGLAEGDWLGIRLTTDDLPLLKEILELFKDDYPPLSQMIGEIEGQLLVTRH